MTKAEQFKEFVEMYSEAAMNKLSEEVTGVIPTEIRGLMKDMFADGLMQGYTIGNNWQNVYMKLKKEQK